MDPRRHLEHVEHRDRVPRRRPRALPGPFSAIAGSSLTRSATRRTATMRSPIVSFVPLHRLERSSLGRRTLLLVSTPGALSGRRTEARPAPTETGAPFDGPDATGPVCSALGVSHPLDGFLHVKARGLVASRIGPGVRAVSRFARPCPKTWSDARVSRPAGSHPPKDSTRPQPHRVSAAVAFLPFRPAARSSLRASDPRRDVGLERPPRAGPLPIPRPRSPPPTSPTSRPCSAHRASPWRSAVHPGAEAPALASQLRPADVSADATPYPSMGSVPLRGLHSRAPFRTRSPRCRGVRRCASVAGAGAAEADAGTRG